MGCLDGYAPSFPGSQPGVLLLNYKHHYPPHTIAHGYVDEDYFSPTGLSVAHSASYSAYYRDMINM